MIKVVVEPYCNECRDFMADVTPPQRLFGDDNKVYQTDTVIFCENRDKCKAIMRYLEKRFETLNKKENE